jgi:hypothetical protein
MKSSTSRSPRRYAYRTRREGSTFCRDYIGNMADPVVRAVVAANELDAAYRQAAIVDSEAALDEYLRRESLIRLLAAEINLLLRQLRKRLKRSKSRDQNGGTMARSNRQRARIAISKDDFDELIERASDGDEDDLNALRQVLRSNPEATALLGDIAKHVQGHLIETLGESVAVREAVRIEMEQLRARLLGAKSGPLQQLVAEQVIITMLDVNLRKIEVERPGIGIARRRSFEQAYERALSRHLKAVAAMNELGQPSSCIEPSALR